MSAECPVHNPIGFYDWGPGGGPDESACCCDAPAEYERASIGGIVVPPDSVDNRKGQAFRERAHGAGAAPISMMAVVEPPDSPADIAERMALEGLEAHLATLTDGARVRVATRPGWWHGQEGFVGRLDARHRDRVYEVLADNGLRRLIDGRDLVRIDWRGDPRIASTVYAVEASSFERLCLWREWHESLSWEQDCWGHVVVIGQLAGMPVNVSLTWAVLDGQRVVFYWAESTVVDHRMVDAWIEDREWPKTDAMNFSRCIHEIQRRTGRTYRPMGTCARCDR